MTPVAVVEKVKFKNKKEHDEIRDRLEKAIEGYDRDTVEKALDQMLALYNN